MRQQQYPSNLVVEYSKDGGAWTGTTNGGWGLRTYTSLVPGSYVFRAYAQNGVGNSAVVQSAPVTVLPGAYVWNGTSYAPSLGVNVWNGTAWVAVLGVLTWNGTAWVVAL